MKTKAVQPEKSDHTACITVLSGHPVNSPSVDSMTFRAIIEAAQSYDNNVKDQAANDEETHDFSSLGRFTSL